MKVLLLGGTGVMGGPLAEKLSHYGHQVFITSRSERISKNERIHYLCGNAFNINFLQEVLKDRYDVVVDFMNYKTDVFEKRIKYLLSSTSHYFFLSSCRVFAPINECITEESSRLIDCISDKDYLATDEYGLAKARCENLLNDSKYQNWTIVRPYITYGPRRLQLGMLEKEGWVYRALLNRSIVFSKDLSHLSTTLTYGDDVSKAMTMLINNNYCLGESINIVGNDSMTWGEVLYVYMDVFNQTLGRLPHVVWLDDSYELSHVLGNTYKYTFDRNSNRIFDNSKIKKLIGNVFSFKSMKEGLHESLKTFISDKKEYSYYNVLLEAWLDRKSGEYSDLNKIPGMKNKIKYLLYRNTSFINRVIPQGDVCW